jgi:hypothetical protein
MIVTYNKAEIVEDENGKKFLHLERQAFIPGSKIILQNTFQATSDYAPGELPETLIDDEILLINNKQE